MAKRGLPGGHSASMALHVLVPFVMVFACVLLSGGCTCSGEEPPPPRTVIACKPQHPISPITSRSPLAIETAAAGTIPVSFSVASAGEASLIMPLRTVHGRGVEPSISLTYSSSGGNGTLGMGFAISGGSAITRCPSNLADGEIREVRYDKFDKLCLDGKPLVVVGHAPGLIEYRTKPDTHTKIIGQDPENTGTPKSFEAFLPSGLVIEYGTTAGTRPRGPGGVPRAWLAAVARDGRGNAMDYGYCFADAGEYTAEYALVEVRYTRFDGSPALEASRAVKFVYGTKDLEDIRTHYSRGMALQSSLRLEEVQMIGPGKELVRRYPFTYELSPTTNRTLLTQVEECAGDVCKPPTRFLYQRREPGFKQHTTNIKEPTSHGASPILIGDRAVLTVDVNADSKVDLLVQPMLIASDGTQIPITKYDALTRREDGTWDVFRTHLPVPAGRVLFVDINADGLPDAVESGFSDGALRTYMNIGGRFAEMPILSLGSPIIRNQGAHFRQAVPLDYNGDGRQDILMPVRGGMLPGQSEILPSWAILQANPGIEPCADGPTFTLVDPELPLDVTLGIDALPADPRAPRIGDVNGDGAADVVMVVGSEFHVFENLAADQDLLIGVADGMNAHDREDEGLYRM